MSREFDLQPDPRILPMLGEINLAPWRCLAELVDNAVDGFLAAAREERLSSDAEVHIALPTSDQSQAKITVRDTGPGMDPATLEKAVRAGWTSNDPINSLGMFGMGFNIATARLGTVTTVFTTRRDEAEWYGVEIDFDKLTRQRTFRAPMLTRPKLDAKEQGTEVTITGLKPEQRQWFAKTANRTRLERDLSRAYAAMLKTSGVPVSFRLMVNGHLVRGRDHCIWGADGSLREVTPPGRLGPVSALQQLDVRLPDRPFCVACWQWVPFGGDVCPACGSAREVHMRQRRIHGWLGVQRYLSEQEYGIDFLRHGRKIEIGNRDLFQWVDSDGGVELEYPIDDPRHRGRIVGEIHVDHCRVMYTKDRFDRNDPAWDEMVKLVRGEGPLRPDKARELGAGENASPLFRLFQAFRRSSPKPKIAGAYARLLIVPDNNRAEEMAKHFYAGEPEYLSDLKWYSLVEEADRDLLRASSAGPGGGGTIEGFPIGGPPGPGPVPPTSPTPPPRAPARPPSPRQPIPSLTREYREDVTEVRWDIRAYAVEEADPDLGGGETPWRLRAATVGHYYFLVNPSHRVFASATLTPLDALLCELASSALDRQRGNPDAPAFAKVIASLRERYGGSLKLDVTTLSAEAESTLDGIARAIRNRLQSEDSRAIFEELSPVEQEAIQQRMAARSVRQPQAAIAEGRFLEFAPRQSLIGIVQRHPDLFFDGKYWAEDYGTLDYERPSVTEEARARVLRHYVGLMDDAAWLEDLDPVEATEVGRARLLRAAMALELLVTAVQAGDDS